MTEENSKLKAIMHKRMEMLTQLKADLEILQKQYEILEMRLKVFHKINDIQHEKSEIVFYCEKHRDNKMIAEQEIKVRCERIRQKCVEMEEILHELFNSTE